MNRNTWHWIFSIAPFLMIAIVTMLLRTPDSQPGEAEIDAATQRIAPFGAAAVSSTDYRPQAVEEAESDTEVLGSEPSPAAISQHTEESSAASAVPNPAPTAQREVPAALEESVTAHPGRTIFEQACAACHSTGAAGAPMIGDVEMWRPRLEQGEKQLVSHAIDGYQGSTGFMPAKGGRTDLADQQVADAALYMISSANGSLPIEKAEPVERAVPTEVASRESLEPSVTAAPTVSAKPAMQEPPRRVPTERVVLRPQEAPMSGKQVYDHACYVCHGPGLTGAPLMTDRRDWRARERAGRDLLYEHAIGGYQGENGSMPAKGGYVYLTDDEIRQAVDYIIDYRR